MGTDGVAFPVALPPGPPYTFPMITKIYWVTRILGYLTCLGGILTYLACKTNPDPHLAQTGLGLVGIGFFSFFISYALHAWMRFGPGRPTGKE